MKKEFNLGLAILRSIMCFFVILCHCWDDSNASGIMAFFSFIRVFAVPVFMFMSFLLVQHTLVKHNRQEIISRFQRLLIPLVGWAVIYWTIYFIIDCIFDTNLEHGIGDMFWQTISGHSHQLNPTMWYQVDLIYITLLFLIIILLFKKSYINILWFIGFSAILMQYSGLTMFFDNLSFELKYPIGRFFEMLPIASMAFIVSFKNLLKKLEKQMWTSIISSIITILVITRYEIFIDISGYGYQGIKPSVIAFALVTLFYVIPFNKLPARIKIIIGHMTNYTMGIYCMHRLIARILDMSIFYLNIDIKTDSFSWCIFIYLLCYTFSWLGTRILGNTKLRSLFN